MKRRLFLKGAGGAALAAPFLSSLQPARAQTLATNPRRLVIFYTQNGCIVNSWFPKVESGALDAAALAGTTLEGLTPFVDKLLFPRGFGMFPKGQVTVNGQSYFDPHDQGMGSKLTSAPIDPAGEHWAMGRSLDHVVAEMINQGNTSPLVLSVGNSFANVKGIISYSGPQEPYSPTTSVSNVYSGITGLPGWGGGEVTEADYRVAQGKSILDLVKADLDTMKRLSLSSADQTRVDNWASLLREVEVTMVSAACNPETATSLGITDAAISEAGGGGGGRGGGFVDTATAFTLGGDMMIKLIALNMMCDANRSIIMHWPGFVTFNWDGVVHDYDHHGLSHRNGSAAVGGSCVTGVLDMIKQIDDWYAGRYVKLVTLIDSITEGDRTMLDNSAVMWLPELADGNAHNNNNLPIVIAGSSGGYLKTGVSVNVSDKELGTGDSLGSCEGDQVGFGGGRGGEVPLNKLYVTLLNALGAAEANGGAPIETFGQVDSNDVEAGITSPGEIPDLRAS